MYNRNLRDWEVTDSMAKDVSDTKLNNTMARESTAKDVENPQVEYVNGIGVHPPPFGTRGRY